MKYLIVINAAPGSSTANKALSFCSAVIAQQHQIAELFFYGEGVLAAADQSWIELLLRHGLTATVCVNSAEKHLKSTHIDDSNPFKIAGMAQLAAATSMCDRAITFGKRSDR